VSSLTQHEQDVIASVPVKLWIGGEQVDATGGGTFAVTDPSTGETLVEVADATPEDARKAMDAAAGAQAGWAATAARQRGEILRGAWQRVVDRADDLALLMTLEMGKALAESRG
jgi:succinate-semialdehyde dehydrogenase/glutarate-semialdehyde dehydrogenase